MANDLSWSLCFSAKKHNHTALLRIQRMFKREYKTVTDRFYETYNYSVIIRHAKRIEPVFSGKKLE